MIFRLLDARRAISTIVLMLQREVALRLVASPGTREYGALTVTASLVSDISIGFHVGRGNFHPRPNVDSAVVKFRLRDRLPAGSVDPEIFSRVVRAAFMGRRKVLANALKPLFMEDAAKKVGMVGSLSGIDLRRRGETLSVEEFAVLARAVSNVFENAVTD
jgi:16S rRNA (adenine1518-N6/adenine1519-N6)-dimethyltransferase